jgi:hypothetical protein
MAGKRLWRASALPDDDGPVWKKRPSAGTNPKRHLACLSELPTGKEIVTECRGPLLPEVLRSGCGAVDKEPTRKRPFF